MNNLCTLLNNLSKRNNIAEQNLDDIGNLIATVVRADLGRDSKSLITNWVDRNDDYIDFSFALRPDWLDSTPDGKQVKMCISIVTCDQSWYAHLVMDCEAGEIGAWGEKEFNSLELEEYSMPVKSMLAEIHRQYAQKLVAEGTAKFRITFRSEFFVDAASEEEARDKFGNMTMDEIGQSSNFVEIVSCEKE